MTRRSPMEFPSRCVATPVMIILSFATLVAGQDVPPAAADFSGLGGTRILIAVFDEAGKETRGQLLRFDAESLTMAAGGRELTFSRQDVRRVYQRGDSVVNGVRNGFISGLALGVLVGVTATD